jgi:hypothetical protein
MSLENIPVAILAGGGFALADRNSRCNLFDMSDKPIERLPDEASLEVIAERVEFLTAARKGLDHIERGQTIPHNEIKRQFASWLRPCQSLFAC